MLYGKTGFTIDAWVRNVHGAGYWKSIAWAPTYAIAKTAMHNARWDYRIIRVLAEK